MEDFGKKLTEYRENRGWSRNYLAEQIKVPMSTLWAWEEGRRVPPLYVHGLLFFKMDSIGLPNPGDAK